MAVVGDLVDEKRLKVVAMFAHEIDDVGAEVQVLVGPAVNLVGEGAEKAVPAAKNKQESQIK